MDEVSKTVAIYQDPIDVLGLSVRVHNCLRRNRIITIEDLLKFRDTGEDALFKIRNMGEKGVAEVNTALERFEFVGTQSTSYITAPNDSEVQLIYVISHEVIAWQANLIERQVLAGTLHREAVFQGQPIGHWLAVAHEETPDRMFLVFSNVLGGALNICEELEVLLQGQIRMGRDFDRELFILTERNHVTDPKTLQQIADHMELSRERVRQLEKSARETLSRRLSSGSAFIRLQSALLIARGMGDDLTWNRWLEQTATSGLCGRWRSADLEGIDPYDLMLALCSALEGDCPYLAIPEELKLALQLRNDGQPDTLIRELRLRESVPKQLKKFVGRHLRFSGGVDASWLSRELNIEPNEMKELLVSLGYDCVQGDWYTKRNQKNFPSRFKVFRNSLKKMFFFCGPLDVEEICAGLRHAISKTDFPVPPPEIMSKLILLHAYIQEEGLYYSEDELFAQMSKSEQVIFDCIRTHGRVVHHSELVKAFVTSELNIASLHGCLNYSPLFDKAANALYHLRGETFDKSDVERATEAADKTTMDLDVDYIIDGTLAVRINLSPLAIASGNVVCSSSRFPNLSGDWDLDVNGVALDSMTATDTEFKRLAKAFKSMSLKGGERVVFFFDTNGRSVSLSLVGGKE